jgi:hypothetical protein
VYKGIGVGRASSHFPPTAFHSGKSPDLPETKEGLDHGVGHPLPLLYDAKALLGKNSNYFNDLCHDLSNPSISLF